MRSANLTTLGATVMALTLLPMATAAAADDAVQFNRDVAPILSDSCFTCHGPDRANREAGLRLDRGEGLIDADDGYAILVPGEPEQSELFVRVTAEDPRDLMPPRDSTHDPLTDEQVDVLRRWIEQGAVYEAHWAFVPPQRVDPPAVDRVEWAANWIDRFVLAELEAEGLSPSEPTDRRTLIRRLSFDLRGLPPTPEEVQAFVNDDRPEAYERVVDAFLASPHFGERMATYWLDLVRYADTVGYHGDQGHHASPYRDWVIDAFNDNMPYDQFTVEQLAGDLLDDAGVDQKIASAYNRLLQTSHEGGVQDAEYRAIQQADRIRNTSTVWMGVTLGCAECHDHFYDPFSIEDFYAFGAFFADIEEKGDWSGVAGNTDPTQRPPEMDVLTRQERDRIASLGRAIEQRQAEMADADADRRRAIAGEIERLATQKEQIKDNPRRVMITRALDEPRTTRVLPGGDWLDDSGKIVEPAIPEVLGTLDVDGRATRLDLAKWLVDEDNPLTARVHVNRLWYLLFGNGIAGVLDDFGFQGERPTHPPLLDALAVEFVESGWDTKHLIRLMVTSSTYRQSSRVPSQLRQRDPDNRLLARQSRWRLPAEFIRDGALAASGLLVDEIGGPSIKPRQPEGYYSQLNFPMREYERSTGPGQFRRGIYMHWQRTYLHPSLLAFDASTREECVAERPESNTSLAALTLMNDPNFVEAARVFAQKLLSEDPELSDRQRIARAFKRTVSRPPNDREVALLDDLLDQERAAYADDPEAAAELTGAGDYPSPEGIDPVEHAAWTALTRALLNLDETIMRH